ncbi:hypothetical protein C5S30_04455 [ANME-1 cluster archaeon GoMg4]|nr:hypothetical protein [ANME-1 cluster archaeon GoMg4]
MDTEEAIDRGIRFLEEKAGHYTHKLENIKLAGAIWIIRFNVGFFEDVRVELKIDDATERVVSYEQLK